VFEARTTYIAVNENEKALEIARSIEWRVQQGDGLDDFYGHYALASSACYSLHRFKEGLEYACKGLEGLCTAYARKGDMVLAEQSALSGIGLLKGIDQPLTMGTLMGNLAVVLIKANRSKEALPLIRNAENAFKPIGLSHWIDLWLSMYHWHRDRDQGRVQFLSALEFYNRMQNFCIVAERHWIVPYLTVQTIIHHFEMLGEFENCIVYTQKYLGVDRTDEKWSGP
jgi:hypothetical protein